MARYRVFLVVVVVLQTAGTHADWAQQLVGATSRVLPDWVRPPVTLDSRSLLSVRVCLRVATVLTQMIRVGVG